MEYVLGIDLGASRNISKNHKKEKRS